MSTNKDSLNLNERALTSFKQLSVAAADLNTISDELGKTIEQLDAALKKLNIGITAWVPIVGNEYHDQYWSRDIGYDRVNNKWGIALRTVSGSNYAPDEEDVEEWLFNDAPRRLRIEAIGKIPELLDKLSHEAEKMTKKVHEQVKTAQELAAVITEAAKAPKKGVK